MRFDFYGDCYIVEWKMNGMKNLFCVLIIGMYVYICIWIYYIIPMDDDILDDSNEDDKLIFAYVVCAAFFYFLKLIYETKI